MTLNEDTYTWVGQYFFDHEKWSEASGAFAALLKAFPAYPSPERVRFMMAECSEKANRPDEAIARYQAVVEAAPASGKAVEAKYRMARLHEAKGDTDAALALYEAASVANNGDVAARARFRIGELQEAREDYEKAARSFMRVAILFLHEELSPESLWRAGECYRKLDKLDRAEKAYQEVVTDFPGSPQAEKARAALEKIKQE